MTKAEQLLKARLEDIANAAVRRERLDWATAYTCLLYTSDAADE